MLAQRAGFPLIWRNEIAGACLRAYVPGPSGPSLAVAPVKQLSGTFSAKTRQVSPCSSSWSAIVRSWKSWSRLSWTLSVSPANRAR